MKPSPGSGRNDVVFAITWIRTSRDPAEVSGLDPAEAESGMAIQIANAASRATAAGAASRTRWGDVDFAAAGLPSAVFG
jgi:hypothetical protein